MAVEFEELDFQHTALGDISLRRRSELKLAGEIVYEVKLGDEFLMSSLFTEGETQLAKLVLAALDRDGSDIVVGGLGLGYTAVAALAEPSVASLMVIEAVEAVIDWHRRGLLPIGKVLVTDPRCSLVHGDFFQLAGSSQGGFHGLQPARQVDAVMLDIDHSPRHWLNAANSAFYTPAGLRCLADKLRAGGIFGLWSNDPPDADFTRLLSAQFDSSESHIVRFANPYTGGDASSTVYLARKQ